MKISDWLETKNQFFSKIGGEEFSNFEVIAAFFGTIALIVGCILAELLDK